VKMLNIAHRGFSSRFPENSLLAFEEGLKAGADGFECDLRMTADSRIVVFHDDDLRRLCNSAGSIEEMNWAEIQKLRIKGTEKIPSLEEMLLHFHTTLINLEIKASALRGGRDSSVVVEQILRELTKLRPQGRILFSSFSHEILRCLQAMDPKKILGQRGILVDTMHLSDLPKFSKELEADTWNVPRQVLNAPWAERWAKTEVTPTKPLWVWTLDEPDDWAKVLRSTMPFEAIITNKPDALALYLSGLGPQ